MGRSGGSYEIKNEKKRLVEATKPAAPVDTKRSKHAVHADDLKSVTEQINQRNEKPGASKAAEKED